MMTEQYVGRVLDRRYQILEFIASGGMAQVFRAVHVGTGRPLAVKILKPKARDNPDNIRRFQREARLTATLEHENIIDIIDVQTDEEVYLVMELLAGVDLRVYLRRARRLAWAEVRAIMLQICNAMQFAHDHGVVHRDLKPANCFRVEPGGRIKVLDLGIARPIAPRPGDPSRITRTGVPTGTPAYMAPEHFCGHADVRTDIYSAGVLMFELLTGRRPFVGEDAELLRQILNTPMPALASVAEDLDCPPGAGAVIECALAKLPEQRYASMRAFAGAIMALDAEPTALFVAVEARSTLGTAEPVSSTATSDDTIDPTTMAIVPLASPPDPPAISVSPFDAPETIAPAPLVYASPEIAPIITASFVTAEARSTLGAAETVSSPTASDDTIDLTTMEIVPIVSRPGPPSIPVSPFDASADPPEIIAPIPPVDAPPEIAPIITSEAPQPVVKRAASTDRRWLGGAVIAVCLLVAGLVPLWAARDPSQLEAPTLPGAPVAVGFSNTPPVVPVAELSVVANASVPPSEIQSDHRATLATTATPQFVSADPDDDDARTAVPEDTSRSDANNTTAVPSAETSPGEGEANVPPSEDISPGNTATNTPLASRTSPHESNAKAPPEPGPKTTSERPGPVTSEGEAAQVAARARQKRQRAAERAVQSVLDQAGVGALVSRVKVTVQWSAAGTVTEAVVHSLPSGAERTGVEGRLREIPVSLGAGPVRVDRTFELKLPE